MENTIEIRPRCSGKTSDLINKFITDKTQSYLILPNHNMQIYIKSHMINIGINWESVEYKIFVIDEFINHLSQRGNRFYVSNISNQFTHVYIDEVFKLKSNQVKKLLECEHNYNLKIHGIGTSMVLYNRNLLDLVRFIKTNGSLNKSMNFLNNVTQEIIEKDYLYNFLTEPSFKIIQSNQKIANYDRKTLLTEMLGQYCE